MGRADDTRDVGHYQPVVLAGGETFAYSSDFDSYDTGFGTYDTLSFDYGDYNYGTVFDDNEYDLGIDTIVRRRVQLRRGLLGRRLQLTARIISDFPLSLTSPGMASRSRRSPPPNVYSDMAGDHYQHRTAWAGAGNGVLVFDIGGDGVNQPAQEVVFTDWDPTAKSDMQALANFSIPTTTARSRRATRICQLQGPRDRIRTERRR